MASTKIFFIRGSSGWVRRGVAILRPGVPDANRYRLPVWRGVFGKTCRHGCKTDLLLILPVNGHSAARALHHLVSVPDRFTTATPYLYGWHTCCSPVVR